MPPFPLSFPLRSLLHYYSVVRMNRRSVTTTTTMNSRRRFLHLTTLATDGGGVILYSFAPSHSRHAEGSLKEMRDHFSYFVLDTSKAEEERRRVGRKKGPLRPSQASKGEKVLSLSWANCTQRIKGNFIAGGPHLSPVLAEKRRRETMVFPTSRSQTCSEICLHFPLLPPLLRH